VTAFRICAAAIAVVTFGFLAAPAVSERRANAVVTVTAGKPTEFDFRVHASKQTLAAHVTFQVTNDGKLPHSFKVCATPLLGIPKNTCAGHATAVIRPGASATLIVGFVRSGTYEFLSSLSGQAARGMVGTISVVITAKPFAASNQGAAGGEALFESLGCSSCHSQVEAQAAGNITPAINQTHTGGPFPDGPLTRKQLDELSSYLNV
jgi:uncharacterized cupredoxin-like copper-binding protein